MIKEKDFIELNYTGKIKDSNTVFDTTDEKSAKDAGIYEKEAEYKPIIVCLGEGQIVKGLEKALIGKETDKDYTIELKPADAYGVKNAKLIQLISTAKSQKQEIQPVPGLQVNIDGMIGTIKTVSGGRTLVDFNHPLSGKDIVYSFRITRIVEDNKEKLGSIIKTNLGLNDYNIEINEKKAKISLKEDLPKEISVELIKKIKELLPLDEITILKEENLNTSAPSKVKGG